MTHSQEKKGYACPMHPEMTAHDPSACCTECGMKMEKMKKDGHGEGHNDHAARDHKGHDHGGGGHEGHDHVAHHEAMAEDFKKRFWLALALAIPVLALSPSIQQWFGFSLPAFPGQDMLLFTLASIIALYAAWPFYKGAFNDELRIGHWGMMTLVSLAVLTGYLYSVATTFFIEAPDFYWEISTLVLVLLLGHWLEMRAVVGASGALRALAKLIPPTANKKEKDGHVREVSTEELIVGDIVLVRPGGKVPIDGIVEEGASNVNEAMITGESKPVPKKKGAHVIGGTIAEDGSLTVRVERVGEDTALSQIVALVQGAQESKPKTQRLADVAAHWLTVAAIVAGVLTFVTWNFIFAQGFLFALLLTITVIVIACPHALGLAIPTVTTIATSLAAKNGILIRDMDGLEKARKADYVVFDKTGTLTKGEFGVTDVVQFNGFSGEEVLSYAASVDSHSEHVIAKSIVKKAKEAGAPIREVSDYKSEAGKGGSGEISGANVSIGNKAQMRDKKIPLNDAEARGDALANEGKTVIYLAVDGTVRGIIALADMIREESREAVERLHERGVKVAMLTGDNKITAAYVAEELGVDTYFAEVLPADKIKKVRELQKGGAVVMMVGDGINDAPALTQAEVGVAIGAGTDVAIESAEIVLVKSSPLDILKLLALSEKTMVKMYQNLVWATGYNIIAIPVAAGVLFPWGVVLRPEWGALVMSASSIIVVANALLLKRVALQDKRRAYK